jgi:hypothetical protein
MSAISGSYEYKGGSMKWKILMVAAGAAIAGWAQSMSVESAPFTFPAEVSVKMPGAIPNSAMYFKYSGPASRAGVLTFSWSFPVQPRNLQGSITVYSLSGRTIQRFPVSANAGSVVWNIADRHVGGVYIARIICGSARQNLKLLLCR